MHQHWPANKPTPIVRSVIWAKCQPFRNQLIPHSRPYRNPMFALAILAFTQDMLAPITHQPLHQLLLQLIMVDSVFLNINVIANLFLIMVFVFRICSSTCPSICPSSCRQTSCSWSITRLILVLFMLYDFNQAWTNIAIFICECFSGVAYSAAPTVAHMTYSNGLGINYAW